MSPKAPEELLRRYARIAGFLYLFVMASFLSGFAILSRFAVAGDFAATTHRIAASEWLYRCGLSSLLFASWTTILLAGAFYVLLEPVDRHLALFALLWRVGEAVLGGVAVFFPFMALAIRTGAPSAVRIGEPEALVGWISHGYVIGFNISLIYFSMGSILFFYLLLKSRFIPRILSVLGVLASGCVTIVGFANLIVPARAAALSFGWEWAPIFAAEIATGLWLLFAGPNLRHWTHRHQDPLAAR